MAEDETVRLHHQFNGSSQVALVVKNLPAIAGDLRDTGLIPGSGRSPGGGNSNLRSFLALSSMDRGN